MLVEGTVDEQSIVAAALRAEAPGIMLDVVGSAADELEHLAGMEPPLDDVLVVADVRTGEVDGIDLLTQVRSDPAPGEVAVVVLSPSARAADMRRAYAAGCNGYFTTPATVGAARELWRTLLDYWFEPDARPV